MAAPTSIPTPATFQRIFVALQNALAVARPRDGRAPLLQPENVWALAVLLGQRAYQATTQQSDDYRLAVRTLGPLGAENQNGAIWTALAEAGEASDRSESLRATEKLAAELKRVGIDLIAALATPARLAVFRDAAQRIVPQPAQLPSLDSLYGPAVDGVALPAQRAIDPLVRPSRAGRGLKLLVYGAPIVGGLTFIAGAVSYFKHRGVHADG